MKKKIIILYLLSLVGLVGLSCREQENTPAMYDSGFTEVMGTFAHFVVVTTDEQTVRRCFDAALQECIRVDGLMSDYKSESELSVVNRSAFEKPVAVSEELYQLIETSLDYSKRTDGAFDITIGPLVDLWRKAGNMQQQPSEEELATARARVGFDKLVLDPARKTVAFAVEGMRLDLGGIAKGYAIDRAVQVMREAGIPGGLVDIGGDVRCFGTPPPGKKHWTIGLQDPQNEEDILLKLGLNDMAVATSGNYRRFVLVGQQKHSHIINPSTRDSAAGLSSVTILAPKAVDADALATAVTVLGMEKGLQLIEGIPETEAMLISSNNPEHVIRTAGTEVFIIQ
ncbi:MAG: FAD:protein FMN transferase [Sedimentisphaerales bacterium]|nr:FAD:protein FMN transferase [Sedimentisphaerales bacterium]